MSGYVVLRLPLPGAVVTWLVAGSWDEWERIGRANLARFQVDRCLGIASCCVPRIAGGFMAWCRLAGDRCQAGASMGRPAAWAASSRRLSYVTNEVSEERERRAVPRCMASRLRAVAGVTV